VTAQMTTTVAGVYRFEWYALAPACFAVQEETESVRAGGTGSRKKGDSPPSPGRPS
jgi:hypothetical protein